MTLERSIIRREMTLEITVFYFEPWLPYMNWSRVNNLHLSASWSLVFKDCNKDWIRLHGKPGSTVISPISIRFLLPSPGLVHKTVFLFFKMVAMMMIQGANVFSTQYALSCGNHPTTINNCSSLPGRGFSMLTSSPLCLYPHRFLPPLPALPHTVVTLTCPAPLTWDTEEQQS